MASGSASLKLLPTFRGTEQQKAEGAIRWTRGLLKKVDWPKEKIEAKLFHETPTELIQNREVFYLNTCASQTAVCLEVLKHNGFKPFVVVDLMERRGHLVPHFALELEINHVPHHVEFKRLGVIVAPGPYIKPWTRDARSLQKFRIPGKRFGMNKTLMQAVGPKIKKQIEALGHRIDAHIERVVREATPEYFAHYRKTVIRRIRPSRLIHKK